MDRFALIVKFDIKPDKIVEFRMLIDENARASVRDEPGCRQFDVLQADDNPARIVLYEVYDDVAAFDGHRTMPHVGKFFGAAKELIVKQTAHRLTRVAANPE